MNKTNQSARETQRFEGDVIINNDLVVGGELKVRGFIKAYGIKYVNKGLFPTDEALKEEWPEPQVGDWAFVGNELPWAIWACRTAGIWIDTGETGGTDLDIPDIRKRLDDVEENVQELEKSSGEHAEEIAGLKKDVEEIRLKITDIEALIGAGYRFIGIATPDTKPVEVGEGTRAMYLAMTEGEYPHFREDPIRLGDNDVALFLNAGKGWDCALLDIPRKTFVAQELADKQIKNLVIDFSDKDKVLERINKAIDEGREVYCNVLGIHFPLMDSRSGIVRFSGFHPVDSRIVVLEYNGNTDIWTAKYINFPIDDTLVHKEGDETISGNKTFAGRVGVISLDKFFLGDKSLAEVIQDIAGGEGFLYGDTVYDRVLEALKKQKHAVIFCVQIMGENKALVIPLAGAEGPDDEPMFVFKTTYDCVEYTATLKKGNVWAFTSTSLAKDHEVVHRKGQERIDGVKQFNDTAEFDGGLVTNDKMQVVNGIDVLPEMDGPDFGPKIIRFFDKFGHMKTLEEYLNGGAGGGGNFGLPRRIIKHKEYVFEAWYDSVDYELARKYVKDWVPSGCSSFLNGREYARNYDWTYGRQASCVVHIGASAGRYSSDAVCSNLPGFEDKEGYVISDELWKVIASRVLDGINEKGVLTNVNVVPIEPGTDFEYAEPESGIFETKISAVMLPRFILDNFDSAKAAAAYIQDKCRVYMPDALRAMGYRPHFGITDKSGDLFIIEFIDGRVEVEVRHKQMTNFVTAAVTPDADGIVYTPADVASGHSAIKENNIQAHGGGLERWNLIVRMRAAGASTEDICRALFYTNAYEPKTSPYWHTEFTGEDMLGKDLTVDSLPDDFAEYEKVAQEHFQRRSRETGDTWHTTHSTIYDLDKGTMRVLFQEEGEYVQFNDPEVPSPVQVDDTIIYRGVETSGSDDSVRLVDDVQPGKNAEIFLAGRERFVRIILEIDDMHYSLTAPIIAREPSGDELMFIATFAVEDTQAIALFIINGKTGRFEGGYAETFEISQDVVKVSRQHFDEDQQMIARENLDLYRKDILRYMREYIWDGNIEGKLTVKTDDGRQYYYLGALPEGLDFGNLFHDNAVIDGVVVTKDNAIVDGRGNLFIAPDGKTGKVLMQPEGAKNPCQYDLAGHTVELPEVGLWASEAFRLEYEQREEIIHKVPEEYLPTIDAITRKEFEAERQVRVEIEKQLDAAVQEEVKRATEVENNLAMSLIWQDFVEVGGEKVRISLYRGPKASLPQGKYAEGGLYVCEDTGELFFAKSDTELVQIGGGGSGGGIPEAPIDGNLYGRGGAAWANIADAFLKKDFSNIGDAVVPWGNGGLGPKSNYGLAVKELLNSIGSSQREVNEECRLIVQNDTDNSYRRTDVKVFLDGLSATDKEIDELFND